MLEEGRDTRKMTEGGKVRRKEVRDNKLKEDPGQRKRGGRAVSLL